MAATATPKKRASTFTVRSELVDGKMSHSVPAAKRKLLVDALHFATLLENWPDLLEDATVARQSLDRLLGKLAE